MPRVQRYTVAAAGPQSGWARRPSVRLSAGPAGAVRCSAERPSEGELGWLRPLSRVIARTCLPLEFGRPMPVVARGEGVWIEDTSGRRYLDAMSGGSMAATLGHGRRDIVAAARAQAETLAFVHNERLTNPAQERLAEELVDVAPGGVRARPVHRERRRRERDGDPDRSQLPRRARRDRAMAGDLAGAGVPRPDAPDPRAHRPSGDARSVRALPAPAPAHPAEHLAIRPLRRSGPRRAGRGARRGGSRERLRLLLRADQRRRSPRVHAAPSFLGRTGRAARTTWLPRVLRRGGDRRRPHRAMVRGRRDGVHARHHRDGEGTRSGIRRDRRGARS